MRLSPYNELLNKLVRIDKRQVLKDETLDLTLDILVNYNSKDIDNFNIFYYKNKDNIKLKYKNDILELVKKIKGKR